MDFFVADTSIFAMVVMLEKKHTTSLQLAEVEKAAMRPLESAHLTLIGCNYTLWQLLSINDWGTVSSGSVAFHSTSICCSAWNLIPSLSSWRWILSRYLWTILETFSTNNFSPRVSSRVFCKYDIAKWDHKILTRVPGHRQLFVVLVCLLLGKYHPEKKSIDLNLLIK